MSYIAREREPPPPLTQEQACRECGSAGPHDINLPLFDFNGEVWLQCDNCLNFWLQREGRR